MPPPATDPTANQRACHDPKSYRQPIRPVCRAHDRRSLATSGILVVKVPLLEDEIQNLSDTIGDLTKTAVGLNLQFRLRVELGPVSQVPDETIAKINELLREVSDKLRLERGL